MRVYRQKLVRKTKSKISWNPTCLVRFFKTLQQSSDALGGLYGADRRRIVKAVLNNYLLKDHLQATKSSRTNYRIPKCHKTISRPHFGMISIQF